MSQENVEIVRRIFEADRRRDVVTAQTLYAPQVEWEDNTGMWGDWGIARGPKGIARAWSRWYEAFEDVQMEFGEVADVDDHVVVTYPLRARGRESGVEVNQSITLLWTLEAGKVARVRSYTSRAEALESVGLRQ